MDAFTEDQIKDAKAFCDFYKDLIHNFNDKTKFYLSDDVVMDYFGQTLKGQKNVSNFIKSNVVSVRHLFFDAVPADKIGFRDTHVIKFPKEPKKSNVPFFSPPKTNEPKTPTKSTQPSTSSNPVGEKGQGDGTHNNCSSSFMSPAKRLRLGDGGDYGYVETDILECERDSIIIKYMRTEGFVEFHRPSIKKLQTETKWKRPCKLSVAYSSTTNQDCTIYLIIYEGNVKCRRNLLKDFSAEESEN